MHICGVILAGGKSSRMGTNKSLLLIDHKPVIKHIVEELETCTDELVIIANEPTIYDFLHLKVYRDRYTDKGPLAGIETALYHVEADVFMLAACDMPFIHASIYTFLLEKFEQHDAIIPVYEKQMHPLAGLYKKSVLEKVQYQLENDILRVKSFFDQINVKYVENFQGISDKLLKKHFFNMNNPEEYQEAKTF